MIKQVNVFVENRQGRVCDVIEILAQKGVNILTLSIADTTDYGVMRLIVDKPYTAQKAISEAGFIAKVTHVIAVKVDHTPGELAKHFALRTVTSRLSSSDLPTVSLH